MTALRADIITVAHDKGIKDTEKGFAKLGEAAKKLGSVIGVSLGVEALISYGKSAVTAFAQEDKAAKILGQTMKNLGIGFLTGAMNDYVVKLSEATGVTQDELRPAFDTLIRSTGNAAKAQELLNLALDVSAGTSKPLSVVTQSLAKAYLGNTASLGKLATGLTKAELASGNFVEIQTKLNDLFHGQAATAADTVAGSMSRLAITAHEAQVTIGEGLVQAFGLLSKSSGITNVQAEISLMASDVSDMIVGLGSIGSLLTSTLKSGSDSKQSLLSQLIGMVPVAGSYMGLVQAHGADIKKKASLAAALAASSMNIGGGPSEIQAGYIASGSNTAAAAALAAKTLRESVAAQKATALAAKQTAAQKAIELRLSKDSAMLSKSTANDNIKRIEIAAALRGKVNDLDKTTLQIQATELDLQQAISDKNVALADQLAARLADLTGRQITLAKDISNLPDANDPFVKLSESMDNLASKLLGIYGTLKDMGSTDYAKGISSKLTIAESNFLADHGGIPQTPPDQQTLDNSVINTSSSGAGAASGAGDQTITVNLNVDGQTLADIVTQYQQNNSASGMTTGWDRRSSPTGSGSIA